MAPSRNCTNHAMDANTKQLLRGGSKELLKLENDPLRKSLIVEKKIRSPITRLPVSNALSRIKDFLPQLQLANEQLEENDDVKNDAISLSGNELIISQAGVEENESYVEMNIMKYECCDNNVESEESSSSQSEDDESENEEREKLKTPTNKGTKRKLIEEM